MGKTASGPNINEITIPNEAQRSAVRAASTSSVFGARSSRPRIGALPELVTWSVGSYIKICLVADRWNSGAGGALILAFILY